MATRINQFSDASALTTANVSRSQAQAKPSTPVEAVEKPREDFPARLTAKLKASNAASAEALQDQVDTSQQARQAESRDRLDSGRQVAQREAAVELTKANVDVAEAQEAQSALEDGRQALEELESVANDRARGNEIDNGRADALRLRIEKAEENTAVQAQQQRRQAEAQDVRATEQRATEERSLTPSPPADNIAGGQAAPAFSQAPPEPAESIVRPRSTDVSSPEAARETGDALGEAINRTRSLEDQVSRFGDAAVEQTESATAKLRAGASRPSLQTADDAQEVADEVARSTIDDAGQASASQPFLSVEAALRVLS
jgi:hypothetical protein